MAKQELDEGLEFEGEAKPKSGFLGVVFSLLKFILSILLIPLVMGLTISFSEQISRQKWNITAYFLAGLISYLILHIFFYEPKKLYEAGQKIIEKMFGFFAPLKNIMRYCLPAYSVLFFILYFIFKARFGYDNIIGYAVFLISFTALMHLFFTAVCLKEEFCGALKGEYFFTLFLSYLGEITLIAVFFRIMLDNFSLFDFLKNGFQFFIDTHIAIYKQLFVLK